MSAEVVSGELHVVPLGDLVQHELVIGCVCGPLIDLIAPNVVIHHSLDGRERSE